MDERIEVPYFSDVMGKEIKIRVTPEQLMELGKMVVCAAQEFFFQIGIKDKFDFGIQAMREYYTVNDKYWSPVTFGGTNRIHWRPGTGFEPDGYYCRDEVMNKYKEWKELQNGNK